MKMNQVPQRAKVYCVQWASPAGEWEVCAQVLCTSHTGEILMWAIPAMRAHLKSTSQLASKETTQSAPFVSKRFVGHTDRSFNIALNPLRPEIFASGSAGKLFAVLIDRFVGIE